MCFLLLLMRVLVWSFYVFFFFQAEDGIRDLVRSRGLGDVYKRQGRDVGKPGEVLFVKFDPREHEHEREPERRGDVPAVSYTHLTLPTSDLV